MKSFMFAICLLISTMEASCKETLVRFDNPAKVENEWLVLTYLHSGTNWTMSVVQIMNQNPIYMLDYLRHGDTREQWNHSGVEVDYTKSRLCFTHESYIIPKGLDPSRNKLLVVLRNYKECLVQTLQWTPSEFLNGITKDHRDYKIYIDNLYYYDEWGDPSTKLLIFYEDLISDPATQITRIAKFFDIEDSKVEEFMENYDYWREVVYQGYARQHIHDPPTSGGNKKVYHSKDFPLEILREADHHIKERHPMIWDKYLSRYETL